MIRTLLISAIMMLTACGGYKTENDKVYYIEYNEAQGRVRREIGADNMTFKVLDNENYAVDFSQVFYQGNPIDSADPKTFVPLSDYIAKDKNHGFFLHGLWLTDRGGKGGRAIYSWGIYGA